MTTDRTVGTETPSLFRNFSWTFVGTVVYAACQWGQLMVLAKLGTPNMVGQFSLALAVTAPVMMFASLQLRGIQATDAKNQFQFGHYLALRIITTVVALPVIAGLAFSGGQTLATAITVAMMGLAKAVEAVSDVFHGLLQKHERMDRIAVSMMAKGVSSLVALVLVVRMTGSIAWGSTALFLCWTVVLLVYDIPITLALLRESSVVAVRPLWSVTELLRLVWLALPMGVVAMLLSLNTNLPRYFLKVHSGEAGLGIFSAMAYVLVGGTTVVGALAQSATPRLAKHFAAKDMLAFKRLLMKLLAVGAAIGAGGVLVAGVMGRELLTLLYTKEYAAHTDVFVLLMVGAGVGYISSFLGYSLTAARRISVQLPLFVMVTGASATTAWWLVPLYGLRGAAWAVVAGAVVQVIGCSMIVARSLAVFHNHDGEAVVRE